MMKFLALSMFGLVCISWGRDPDSTGATIHSTFDMGGTLVREATNGIGNATGGGTGGSGLSVPDGWEVQTLPDGRRIAVPPGSTVTP